MSFGEVNRQIRVRDFKYVGILPLYAQVTSYGASTVTPDTLIVNGGPEAQIAVSAHAQ